MAPPRAARRPGWRRAVAVRPGGLTGAPARPESRGTARWWGPRKFTIPSAEIDSRVGGRYRIAMRPPKGETFHLSGEFREFEPPVRLAYTFRWEPPDPDDRETLVSVAFEDEGGVTRVIVRQGAFATEERRALHRQGWTETLERLEEHLSSRASPPGADPA